MVGKECANTQTAGWVPLSGCQCLPSAESSLLPGDCERDRAESSQLLSLSRTLEAESSQHSRGPDAEISQLSGVEMCNDAESSQQPLKGGNPGATAVKWWT